MVTVVEQIHTARDTAANWTSNNPTLGDGEIGYETDTGCWKFGDGATAWNSLVYRGGHRGFRAYRSTSQSIANSVDTTIVCNNTNYDTDSLYNTGTGILTIPATWNGLRFDVQIGWRSASFAKEDAQVTLRRNDGGGLDSISRINIDQSHSNGFTWMNLSAATGDTWRVDMFVGGGATLDNGSSASEESTFMAARLAY